MFRILNHVFLLLVLIVNCSTAIAIQSAEEIDATIKLAQLKQAQEFEKSFNTLYEKGDYKTALDLKQAMLEPVFSVHFSAQRLLCWQLPTV